MSFKEIYGHNKIKEKFKILLKDDKLSHSYIFEGKAGVGKKLFAKNVAKALLCLNNVDDPCDNCRSCLKINHKNHPDFFIIQPDGSSIKNDQIKEFQDFLKIIPNESEQKIVIINKSHTMTTQAQNTILKILEEPPEYALIILISENSDKLLPTINSRCQKIKFNNLKEEEISEFLIDHHHATSEEVKLISIFSNGSIKRAVDSYNSEEFIQLRKETIDMLNGMIINDKFFVINNLSFFTNNKDKIDLILELMMTWFRDLLILKETNHEEHIINKDKIDILKKQTFKADHLNFVEIINKIKDTKININEYNVNYDISIENLIFSIIN